MKITAKQFEELTGENNGRDELGHFVKGHKQSNSGKTHFKKGRIVSEEQKEQSRIRNKLTGNEPPHYSGNNHPGWKGGKKLSVNGYWEILSKNHPLKDVHGYMKEHRLVMEKFIGRYLNRKEVVHHINGIKTDNRIENLTLFNNSSEHAKFHDKNRKKNKGKFLGHDWKTKQTYRDGLISTIYALAKADGDDRECDLSGVSTLHLERLARSYRWTELGREMATMQIPVMPADWQEKMEHGGYNPSL